MIVEMAVWDLNCLIDEEFEVLMSGLSSSLRLFFSLAHFLVADECELQ